MRIAISVAIAIACLGGTLAQAATPGDRLLVQSSCDSSEAPVSIVPGPSLARAVEVDGAVGGLSTEGGTVHVTTACHGSDALSIRVPPTFPVRIEAVSGGAFHLGGLAGPVIAHLDGGATLTAGALSGGLDLRNDGGGDVQVKSLAGASSLVATGSGDLSIGHIDAPSLAVALSGSGDGAVGDGEIGTLRVALSGSGDFAVGATVGGGSASTDGSGDIAIRRVTGVLTESRGGSGNITFQSAGAGVTPGATPPVAIPPMPAVALTHARSGGSELASATAVLALAAATGTVFLLLRRANRRAAGPTTAAPSADPRIRAAAERLDAVAQRVGRVEALVTSREFDLHRRFREMGD